ncbi:MAG: hypothetical protein IAF58_21260 [Leptolyngbya sp.]|nr:hypothetical protein [Candidatus Melainabacteria bacterium]
MADKKTTDNDKMHGRSREVAKVVDQMSDVDFFDYRLIVRPSGMQELVYGHSGLRQGLQCVESLCEELRAGNYGAGHGLLLRSLETFEQSHQLIRRSLVDLGEYYNDHPNEVREINHGLTEMCDGCDCLVKALVALRHTKTGEALELSRRALTHLREAAHRVGSHLRDIRDCCPTNIEYQVMDIRDEDRQCDPASAGSKEAVVPTCHSPSCENPEHAHSEVHVEISKKSDAASELTAEELVATFARSNKEEDEVEEAMRLASVARTQTMDKLVADARAVKAVELAKQAVILEERAAEARAAEAKAKDAAALEAKAKAKAKETQLKEAESRAVEDKKEEDKKARASVTSKRPVLAKSAQSDESKNEYLKGSVDLENVSSLNVFGNGFNGVHSSKGNTVKALSKEDDLGELTFDDADLDYNKAAKKAL